MNRAELKGQAKDLINGHFKFYLVLLLPFYILQIATGVAQTVADIRNVNVVHWAWIISFASSLIMVGVTFVMIDLALGLGTMTHLSANHLPLQIVGTTSLAQLV